MAEVEQNWSSLRMGCVREAVIKGSAAIFLVAGSGGIAAVTRGANSQIPYAGASNVQNTATLVEYHSAFEMTGFNVFATQGNQKRVMQMSSIAVMNRNIDGVILTALSSATNTAAGTTGSTASLALVAKAKAALGMGQVDTTEADNMFAVVSPGFMAYLAQTTEFANSLYVDVKTFAGPTRRMLRWYGVNWIESPLISALGTTAELCYMWHRNGLGHAANVENMDVLVGYDEKQDSSWSRASLFHGAVLMQQAAVVQIVHDGSAFTAT